MIKKNKKYVIKKLTKKNRNIFLVHRIFKIKKKEEKKGNNKKT